MPYAETSFFIAFMNTDDEHHKRAYSLYKQHKNTICTSSITIAELLVGAEKHGLDPETIIGSVFQIADVTGMTNEEAMRAAHCMKENKLKAMDALHCALAGNEIISADKDMEKAGIRRIW